MMKCTFELVILYTILYLDLFADAEPRCPVHWIKIGASCYRTRYNYAVKTWQDARRWCQTQNADLAKFNNVEEMDAVELYNGLLVPNVQFWIGMHRVGDEWRWTDKTLVDKSIVDSAVVNLQTGYDCMLMGKTFGITGGNCLEKKGVLCQLPAGRPIRCNANEDYQSYGEKCYQVINKQGDWNSARAYCTRLNASVASPRTAGEQFALFDFVQNSAQPLWIGLYATKFSWRWSDQSSITTAFWRNDMIPSQGICGYIDPDSKDWTKSWRSAICNSYQSKIICEQPAAYIYSSLEYHKELKTWYEANDICSAAGGSLSTRDEAYLFDDNAWVAGIERNDLCPFVTATGVGKGVCTANRPFVCNTTGSEYAKQNADPPTSPAVVAVVILIIIFGVLAVILLIIWYRRKKRKENKKEEDLDCKINGVTNAGYSSNKKTSAERKSDAPSDTYDHTTSSQPVSSNGNPNSVYSHCTKMPEDTYDHTDHNGVSNPTEEYGNVDLDDDGEYKSIDRTGAKAVNVDPNYTHC